MKKFNFSRTSLSDLFNRLQKRCNWQAIRNNSRTLVSPLLTVVRLMFDSLNKSNVLLITSLCLAFFKIARSQGCRGLALYTKQASLLLMQSIGGSPSRNTSGLRLKKTLRGIPRIIPSVIRKEIRQGNILMIKLILTLFSIYRVLEFKGKFSIKTIINPGKDFNILPYQSFVPIFFELILREFGAKFIIGKFSTFILPKAGPGSAENNDSNRFDIDETKPFRVTSLGLCLAQLFTLYKPDSDLWKHLLIVSDSTAKTFESRVSFREALSRLWTTITLLGASTLNVVVPETIGKLGFHQEPGKVRVFAIVDYWTQLCLKPLHEGLFQLLSFISSDATHDQNAAVRRLIELIISSPYKVRKVWSFDLSAATDRLPVSIQVLLLEHLLGTKFASSWKSLLVDRTYTYKYSKHYKGCVRYAVGQPIGALSSWAMLALTHHFIVQFAAYKSGYRRFFTQYIVLGDDIVILESCVAQQYLLVIKDLGVDISASKSLISRNGSFEFAKRFIYKGQDASPISLKEVSVAKSALQALLELLKRHSLQPRLSSIIGFLGKGYRCQGSINAPLSRLSRSLRLLLVFLSQPGVHAQSFSSWADWFFMVKVGETKVTDYFTLLTKLIAYLQSMYRLSPMQDYNILQPFGLNHLYDDPESVKFGPLPDQKRVNRLVIRLMDIFGAMLQRIQGESLKARLNEYRVKLSAIPLNSEGVDILVSLIRNHQPMNTLPGLHSDITATKSWVVRRTSSLRISVGSWLRLWSR